MQNKVGNIIDRKAKFTGRIYSGRCSSGNMVVRTKFKYEQKVKNLLILIKFMTNQVSYSSTIFKQTFRCLVLTMINGFCVVDLKNYFFRK